MPNEVKFIYLNARSMIGKLAQLECLAMEKEPDVIILTETWLTDTINNAEIAIQGYDVTSRLDRGSRGGGIIVYAKTCLRARATRTTSTVEYAAISVRGVQVHVFYRSPSSSEETNATINQIISECGSNSLVIGDFNRRNICWDRLEGASLSDDKFITATQEAFLTQVIRDETHRDGGVLDLIFTDDAQRVTNIEIDKQADISDHFPISFDLSTKDTHPKEAPPPTRAYDRADWEGLRQYLSKVEWTQELRNGDADMAWTRFKTILQAAMDKYIPWSHPRKGKTPCWMNSAVKSLIRHRARLWKKAKDNKEAVPTLQSLNKQLKREIKQAKLNYECHLAQESNSRAFYRYMNSKSKAKTGIGPLRNDNEELVEDPREQANILNGYFASVFTREKDFTETTCPTTVQSTLQTVYSSPEGVFNKIWSTKARSAPGPDGISPRVLREAAHSVAYPLSIIYNLSLSSGVIPEDWRLANVTPIFKKGSKENPGNYRPVSLTSVPGKILEKIVKDRVMEHLEQHNLIIPEQHGFQPQKSCTTNLLQYTEMISDQLDRGLPVDSLYFDFQKAFDTVPHRRLCTKLRQMGIGGHLLRWIQNWLRNRKQRVTVGDGTSDWREVLSGVPQGSILGPVLFVVFINDITVGIEGAASLFADDAKILSISKSTTDQNRIQKDVDTLNEWAARWQMRFNVTKCKVIHFGRNNAEFTYSLDGIKLESSLAEKDVGVWITPDLKPSLHTSKMAAKANSILGQIKRTFVSRKKELLVKLYKTYVLPHLTYCSPACRPYLQKDINKLEAVQRRMTRMVSEVKGRDYDTRLKLLGLLPLACQHEVNDGVMMYKIMNNKVNLDPKMFFSSVGDISTRTTRATENDLLSIQKSRTEQRRQSFARRGARQWNSIPRHIRQKASLITFKRELRQHLATKFQVSTSREE